MCVRGCSIVAIFLSENVYMLSYNHDYVLFCIMLNIVILLMT